MLSFLRQDPLSFRASLKKWALLASLLVSAEASFAQGFPAVAPASLKDGLKTYLTADSTTFLKLNFVAQV